MSAAKAAVDALFRVLAVEYGPRGVRASKFEFSRFRFLSVQQVFVNSLFRHD